VELFANAAQTTLASSISSSAGTLSVALASAFPSTGNFRILIDSEVILVTGVSGTTFTLDRNPSNENATPAFHAAGATVTLVATNGAMQAFRSDTISQGTFAARPAAGVIGRQYRATNGNVVSQDTGSVWQTYGPVFPLTDPTLTTWSWVNQGSATVSTAFGGLYVSAPAGSGASNLNIYETTITGSSATFFLALNGGLQTQAWLGGISVRAPAAGQQIFTVSMGGGSGSVGSFILDEWTNPTTFNTSPGSVAWTAGNIWPQCFYVWFRYTVVGGLAFYSFSGDGITFSAPFAGVSPSLGLGATATTIGVFLDNVSASNTPISMHILSFSQP
jgi:hypothetical protein